MFKILTTLPMPFVPMVSTVPMIWLGISIALFFVLIVTKAYKKSVSTTINVVSLMLAAQAFFLYGADAAYLFVFSGATLSLIRAVINTRQDTIIKRGNT